jgi:hypothetical protein
VEVVKVLMELAAAEEDLIGIKLLVVQASRGLFLFAG